MFWDFLDYLSTRPQRCSLNISTTHIIYLYGISPTCLAPSAPSTPLGGKEADDKFSTHSRSTRFMHPLQKIIHGRHGWKKMCPYEFFFGIYWFCASYKSLRAASAACCRAVLIQKIFMLAVSFCLLSLYSDLCEGIISRNVFYHKSAVRK